MVVPMLLWKMEVVERDLEERYIATVGAPGSVERLALRGLNYFLH